MKPFILLPILVSAMVVALVPATASAADTSDYLEELIVRADEQELADERQWHALMHYRPRLFRGDRSDIDSPEFFLSPRGYKDPQAEIEATLTAFFNDLPDAVDPDIYDAEHEHPQCRFRARYAWLNEQLDFDPRRLEEHRCADFESWRDTIDAKSATLVFAAPYLSTPASMFGHTLMRLDRGEDYGGALESYVVNVTADPWTFNPLLYTAMGLVGGFDGLFVTLPFELKIQKYNDRERRELWEYELNFDTSQLELMVRHLWELRVYTANYRYYDENCSYFLMSVLEVADPSLGLIDDFGFSVLPGNMVRSVLGSTGLAGERHFRPSSRQAMIAKRDRLNTEETRLAYRLGNDKNQAALAELDELSEERQALVLDAAHALWRYQNPPQEDAVYVENQWARELQQRRSALDIRTAPIEPRFETAPEGGHATSRLTIGGGISQHQAGFVELGIRPLVHDLVASQIGYPPLSQLEVFNARIRASGLNTPLERPTVVLEQLDILNIISLAPLDRWSRSWSWSIKTGLERTYRDGCGDQGCLFYDAAAGVGPTVELGNLTSYLLLDTQLAYGSTFDYNLRLATGPRLGALFQMGELARLHVEGRYRYPLWGEGFPCPRIATDHSGPPWAARATVSISPTQNFELRATGLGARNRGEANLEIHLYF